MKTLKKSEGALGNEDAEMENAGDARLGLSYNNRRSVEAIDDRVEIRPEGFLAKNPVASMQAALAFELSGGTPLEYPDRSFIDGSIETMSRIAGPVAMVATMAAAAWAVGLI